MKRIVMTAVLLGFTHGALGNVYAYVNEEGDYVVSQKKPGRNVAEYAVLTDDGEFLRLVRAREPNVPLSHWRPWFMPREQEGLDVTPDLPRERTGVVEIDEVSP